MLGLAVGKRGLFGGQRGFARSHRLLPIREINGLAVVFVNAGFQRVLAAGKILLLVLLFFYLFVFAGIETLLGHPSAVSANAQLILGNLTNVTSAMGACIAAGMTVHLSHEQRKRHKELSDLKALVHRLHEKHDAVHPEAADIDRS